MAKTRLWLLLCVAMTACATPKWDRPGATQQDFNTDSYACERDMRQSGYYGGGIAGAMNAQSFQQRCMVSKGWSKR